MADRAEGGGTLDISELVTKARCGDDRALAEVVRRCSPLVKGVVRRHVSDSDDVDDVVQEVWLTFIEYLDRIDQAASTPGWLAQVAKRAAWRSGRQRRRTSPTADIGELASGDDTEELGLAAADHDCRRQAVHSALARLRPRDRHLVELLVSDDRPDYRAVAASVGCPIGTIGPTRQRILTHLRREPCIARLAARDDVDELGRLRSVQPRRVS